MTFPARSLFDIPDDVSYLDCAYLGPLPKATVQVGLAALERKAEPWRIGVADFFEPVQHYRELVAGLLGGDAEGVAVTPSVSYGIATAAANLPVEPGQQIVTLADEFPSNVYAWRHMATRHEARVFPVERPTDDDWTAAVLDHLDREGDEVAVVSVPPCHWSDGTRLDLEAVGERCRAIGAALVVDAAQAAGALPFSVTAVQPDFVTGVVYKWLLGPFGLGFLWVAPHRRSGTPLEHGWLARVGSDDFTSLGASSDELRPGARRFDVGEASQLQLLPPAIESLQLVSSWGVSAIAAHAGRLNGRLADGAEELGFDVAPPECRSPHIVGLRRPGLDAGALSAVLSDAHVHVSVRGDAIRVSAHGFNTDGDVDRLLAALASPAGQAAAGRHTGS